MNVCTGFFPPKSIIGRRAREQEKPFESTRVMSYAGLKMATNSDIPSTARWVYIPPLQAGWAVRLLYPVAYGRSDAVRLSRPGLKGLALSFLASRNVWSWSARCGRNQPNIRNQATLGPPGCEKLKRWGETLENKMRQERREEQDAHGPS